MKRGVILALCIICLSPLILGISGVSPAIYEVDFEPNLKQEFRFVYSFDKGVELEAYINEGPLSQYVTIKSEEYKFGKKEVIVELKLPAKVDIPGLHRIRVGARPLPSAGQGVTLSADGGGIIKVRIPYPGKYAELSLNTEFANVGEDIPYTLSVNSRGEEDIFIKPILEIRNTNNKLINTINLEDRVIKSREAHSYEGVIKTTDYQPGDYNLTAIVEFGGEQPTTITVLFRLGELKIQIINFTKEVEPEKLNRFRLEIESLWNDPIPGVYGTIKIIGYPEKTAKTPSITLKPWKKMDLVGFIDTTGIDSKKFQAELRVYYANKTTFEIVEVGIIQKTNWVFIAIVIGSIIAGLLVLSLIVIIVFLLVRLKYSKKSNITKKNKK